MSRKYVTESGEFKGHPTLSVWEIKADGTRAGNYPLISLGKRKAQALLDNLEALKAFAGQEAANGN